MSVLLKSIRSTNVDSASGSFNYFVGQDVDSYTNMLLDGGNSNSFTGTHNVNPSIGGHVNILASTNLQASNGAIYTNDSDSAPQYASINVIKGLSPVDKVTIDGKEFSKYQVTIEGVLYNAYFNDRVKADQVRLEPISLVTFPNATSIAATQTNQAVSSAQPVAAPQFSPPPINVSPTPASQGNQWAKETIIHEEEVHFFAGQNTPPPEPDHRFGFYPIKDTDERLGQRYGGYWEALKSALNLSVLRIAEDLAPYNAPDHFLSAGSYANRWVWFSQHGQGLRGLINLFQGHLEASSAVGSAEAGGALLKGGIALLPAAKENLVDAFKAPAYWLMAAGVEYGGITTAPQSASTALKAVNELPALSPEIDSALSITNKISKVGSLSEATPNFKGIVGEERSIAEIIDQDGVPIGQHVSFRGPTGQRTTIDIVWVDADGVLRGTEAKFGEYADLTKPQSIVYPNGGLLELIPVGGRAEEAGFIIGIPVLIHIDIARWLF